MPNYRFPQAALVDCFCFFNFCFSGFWTSPPSCIYFPPFLIKFYLSLAADDGDSSRCQPSNWDVVAFP